MEERLAAPNVSWLINMRYGVVMFRARTDCGAT